MAPAPPSELLRDVAKIARLPAVPTILRVITETTGLRYSLVARVTNGEWIACAVHDEANFGLKAGDPLDVTTTLCSKVRDTREVVVMDHASQDPDYADHPTPKLFGFESYISVPLFDGKGEYFGTLCGLDARPLPVKQPKVVEMMKHFSQLISLQLAAEDRQAQTDAQLLDAQEAGVLREQFVAVLGHDLRSPLASLRMGVEVLLRRRAPDEDRQTLERMRTTVHRMTNLVTDLLDFARSKLGSGLQLDFQETPELAPFVRHVIAEVQAAHPGREIRATIGALGVVRCDLPRLGQVVSNLLSNAIQHGAADRPIQVRVERRAGQLELTVHNEGPPIPASARAKLFQPYTRGTTGAASQGLGLGLYIVQRIAQAHGGTVDVQSTADTGTTFTFALPVSPAPGSAS